MIPIVVTLVGTVIDVNAEHIPKELSPNDGLGLELVDC